jgi:hypothetical protein
MADNAKNRDFDSFFENPQNFTAIHRKRIPATLTIPHNIKD